MRYSSRYYAPPRHSLACDVQYNASYDCPGNFALGNSNLVQTVSAGLFLVFQLIMSSSYIMLGRSIWLAPRLSSSAFVPYRFPPNESRRKKDVGQVLGKRGKNKVSAPKRRPRNSKFSFKLEHALLIKPSCNRKFLNYLLTNTFARFYFSPPSFNYHILS